MAGLTAVTGIEIYTQPDDLQISIPREGEDGNYAILITRGPGHRFKLLASTEFVFDTLEVALENVREALLAICQKGMEELTNQSSLIGRIVNPNNLPVERMKVLTAARVEQIVEALRRSGVASTYELAAT